MPAWRLRRITHGGGAGIRPSSSRTVGSLAKRRLRGGLFLITDLIENRAVGRSSDRSHIAGNNIPIDITGFADAIMQCRAGCPWVYRGDHDLLAADESFSARPRISSLTARGNRADRGNRG
jgi:hypothetical protein